MLSRKVTAVGEDGEIFVTTKTFPVSGKAVDSAGSWLTVELLDSHGHCVTNGLRYASDPFGSPSSVLEFVVGSNKTFLPQARLRINKKSSDYGIKCNHEFRLRFTMHVATHFGQIVYVEDTKPFTSVARNVSTYARGTKQTRDRVRAKKRVR